MLFILVTLFSLAFCTTPEGLKFLEEYSKRDGVITLPSGLRYRVLKSGDGNAHPKVGTLIDGTEFDSSYKRGQPTTFAPNQVIKGWTEAMQLMVEGDHWELAIPSELAYGNSQRGPHITPGAVLLFELELLEIKGPSTQKEL